eukprot:5344955-Amphidinium_carterae.1
MGSYDTAIPAEKLDHAGLDEIITIIRCLGRALEKGEGAVIDVHGECQIIRTHHAWKGERLIKLI